MAQVINYLKASRMPVGYVINFGHPDRLEWKRVIVTGQNKSCHPPHENRASHGMGREDFN